MKRLKVHFSRHRHGSDNIRNEVEQGPAEIATEAPSRNVAERQVSPDNPTATNALQHPASDTKGLQPAKDAEKTLEKPGDAPKKQETVSVARLANSSLASPPSAPAQPTACDSTAAPPPIHDVDPWTQAYKIFQNRQPELMADYKKHLASLQDDAAVSADLSTPRSVESIVKQLVKDREKKQWRVSLLGKDIKVREQAERLTKFLLWSDPIVKNAISAQPYAALAWSGVSLLLPLLTSTTARHEDMLKGFNSIGDIQVYWNISEKTYLQSSHRHNYRDLLEPLAKLYSHIIEYQAKVICHLSSAQLSRAWQNVTDGNDWLGLAGEVNDLSKGCSDCIPPLREEELRKYRDTQLQEMQESRTILDEIRHILEEGREQIKRNYDDQNERDLLQDLASDYESYKNFNPLRVAGTCEWFFNDNRFLEWRDSSISRLLWVSAGPGCGKSVLSRALIDEGRLSTNVTTSTVCHFFFKEGDQGRMDSTNALCAILHQLLTQETTGSLIRDALQIHRKYGEKLTETFSALWQILEMCARSTDTGEIVCVLDALDECNTNSRQQLIDQLKDYYCKHGPSSLGSKLKFLITSRPYDDLEASFRKFSDTTAYLRFDGDNRSKEISQEINLVIDARLDDIAGDFANEDRHVISERLKSMDHRTYLWLYLTFDIIKQNPCEYGRLSDVDNLFSDIPVEIFGAYEKILSRSKNEKRTEILLQIVLAATEPLTVDEANIALTLALQKEQFKSHEALIKSGLWPSKTFQSTVKNLCGLFVNIHDSKLFLIHQTAREFLLSSERQGKWKGRFNMMEAHNTISRSCLYYLVLPDIVAPAEDDGTDDQQYPFLPYAAIHWPLHFISQRFRDAGIGTEKEMSALALSLCETGSERYKAWSAIYAYENYGFPRYASSLTIVSYLGFETVVKLLLVTSKIDMNERNLNGQTPLSWAARNGHEAVVKLLLETAKIDVDSRDSYDHTPLHWAAQNGYEAVVKLLLETGKVDVDLRDSYGQTPLSWAAEYGHETIIRLLLKTGKADVNSRDSYGQTPLSWAAENGHETIIRLLLKTGKADVNSRDSYGQTSLHQAAENGHEAVVKLLLKTGKADVDSRDSHDRTSLHQAAENGHEAVVKLLLETGKVDVDSRDSYDHTPLHWAAQNGHEAVVKLLLETGKVDVDSRDSYSQTPLHQAAENGHEAIIRLLLKTGKADMDSRDLHGQTPLSCAAENGHEAVVKLLLKTGKADVNSRDSYDHTPLHWAAENGHEAVIKLLLEIKVDVDSRDLTGRTPLSWAAENGHEAVVRLLLKTGKADVNSKDSVNDRTALLWAAENGHEAIIKLLLETKVDVDSRDLNGRTPLSWAARYGHEAVVRLLLETGKVDVNSRDSYGRTPLSWAAEHDSVVKLLQSSIATQHHPLP